MIELKFKRVVQLGPFLSLKKNLILILLLNSYMFEIELNKDITTIG